MAKKSGKKPTGRSGQIVDVFVSHSGDDVEIAVAIATGIEAGGYRTWYYKRDMLIGPKHLDQTRDAIGRAAAVLVIVSPSSVKSNQVTTEIEYAHERGKIFMPLLLGMTWDKLRTRRKTWAHMFGAAAGGQLEPDAVDAIVERLLLSLADLGITRRPSDPGQSLVQPKGSNGRGPSPTAASPGADADGGTAATAPEREAPFDNQAALELEDFAFPAADVLWRGCKRMRLEQRTRIDTGDLTLGLVRRGALTRALLGELGANGDALYESVMAGLPGGENLKPGDVEFVVERARMDEALATVLVTAGRTTARTDTRIYEHDLLVALTDSGLWDRASIPGLPDGAALKRVLDRRVNDGNVPWRDTIVLDDLDDDALETVYAAHVMAQQQGQEDIGQRIFLAALLRHSEGFTARACSLLKVDARDLAIQLFQSAAAIAVTVQRGGVRLSLDATSFGLGRKACARLVLPVLERARKQRAGVGKLSERDLLRALAEEAEPIFCQSMAAPPLNLDLALLASVDPDAPHPALAALDRDGVRLVRLAHFFAQLCGARDLSAPVLLLAFFQQKDPDSDLRRVLNRPARKTAEVMLLSHLQEGPPSSIILDAKGLNGFLGPLVAHAKTITASERVGQSALLRALAEAMPNEWNDRLRKCGVDLRGLALAAAPN